MHWAQAGHTGWLCVTRCVAWAHMPALRLCLLLMSAMPGHSIGIAVHCYVITTRMMFSAYVKTCEMHHSVRVSEGLWASEVGPHSLGACSAP